MLLSRLLVLSTAAYIACSAGEHEAAIPATAALLVTPDVVTVAAGSQRQLAAQANDPNGEPIPEAPIAFASANPALLSVSERGEIAALGATGATEIVVTSGDARRVVPVTVTPGPPASIAKEGGDLQRAPATSTLPLPIVVALKDAHGNPIPAARIRFAASDGGVEPAEGETSRAGLAEARWTLGKTAGEQRLAVVASARDSVAVHFVATAEAGPLAALGKLPPEPGGAVVGATLSPRVRATDEFGNPRPGVAVLWDVATGEGRVAEKVTTTDADGIATAAWTVARSVGVNTIVARAAGLPGQDARFSVTTRPDVAVGVVAESPNGAAPAVRVVDRFENPVPAVVVRFRIVEGGGVVEDEAAMTDDRGIAKVERWAPEETPAALEATIEGGAAPVRFERKGATRR